MIGTFTRLFSTKRRGAVMVFTALFISGRGHDGGLGGRRGLRHHDPDATASRG